MTATMPASSASVTRFARRRRAVKTLAARPISVALAIAVASDSVSKATTGANRSATERWTRKRFAAVQACPTLGIFASTAPSIARSRSASSKTMNGALPPSSIETRSTRSEEARIKCLPTAVDPVKDSLRRR